MPDFRATVINTTDVDAEPHAWHYTAKTYHDGYNHALRLCTDGWVLLSVTTV